MIYQAQVKPALALVEAQLSDGVAYGSAFCIASDATGSYFLTNHHVVYDQSAGEVSSDVALLFPDAPTHRVAAKVVKSGALALAGQPPDLAVLYVRKGHVRPVTFSAARALEAQAIGVAGFPAFQLELWKNAKELEPTVALGSVNGLNLGNYYVQYDAKTDHGNSGGPVFDSLTGYVVGVVDVGFNGDDAHVNNYLAISEAQAVRFISSISDVHPTVAMPSASELAKRLMPERKLSSSCQGLVDEFSERFGQWTYAHAIALAHRHGASGATVALARVNALADSAAAFGSSTNAGRLAAAIVADARTPDSHHLAADVERFNGLDRCR